MQKLQVHVAIHNDYRDGSKSIELKEDRQSVDCLSISFMLQVN